MSYAIFIKESVLARMAEICEPHEFKYARAAFDGDVDAAESLTVALRNDLRGEVAVAMWRSKVPKEAFRAYLSSTWGHDHQYVVAAAETRRTLGYMFRYAAFPVPAELPDLVPVWRGTSRISIEDAKTGYSWTTDRDIACWFAMRFARFDGSPLVLSAVISKRDIALSDNGRNESEILLIRSPDKSVIDGNEDDWKQGHARNEAKIRPPKSAVMGEVTHG